MDKLKGELVVNGNEVTMNGVIESLNLLMKSITAYQYNIGKKASEYLVKNEWDSATELVNKGKEIDLFIKKVENLKREWIHLIYSNDEQPDNDVEDREEISATARTSWTITDGKVRIETEKTDGKSYSNIIPLDLFKQIIFCALQHIEKYGFVKISNVLNDMKNEIMSKSDYKKSPRMPIYATFKVLMKEEFFYNHEENSHKYLLSGSKEDLINWIDKLK